jgi:hypothetical protein
VYPPEKLKSMLAAREHECQTVRDAGFGSTICKHWSNSDCASEPVSSILKTGTFVKLLLDIPYYLELQRRMFDIFRYVSCHEKNFDTYSVVLESLLVDACSFFDSMCQTFIREQSLAGHTFKKQSETKRFTEKASGKEEFNFGDYRALLEDDYALSNREINLNPYEDALYSNPMHYSPDQISGYLVSPFKEWAVSGSGIGSPWWQAFTALKHDRLRNFREAKLKNAIDSLAAAFMILTLRNETEFKAGTVPSDLYDLFFPKYWTFKGRLFPGIVTWL